MSMKHIVLFIIFLLVLPGANVRAQSIVGPAPVGVSSTHTYYYDNGSYITGIKWVISSGTIGTKWSEGTRYFVNITFPSSTGARTITLQDVNGTITTKSVTVNTCSTVTAPTPVNGNHCGPGAVTLATNSVPSGYLNRWYAFGNANLIIATGEDEYFVTPHLTESTLYRVRRVQTSTGCVSSAVTITASITELPLADAGADQVSSTTCGLTSVTLGGNTPAGSTGAWTITSGTGGSLTNSTSATSAFNGVNGSTYTLRWTVTANSCPAYDDMTVTLNKKPTAAASGTAIFSGKTTSIALSNPNSVAGTQYSWTTSSSNVTGGSSASGLTIAQQLSTSAYPGTITYTITPYSALCTGTSIAYNQNVYRVPAVTTSVNRVAPGIPVKLHAPNTYTSWRWKNSTQQLVGTDSAFSTSTPGSYTVTVRKTGVADSVTSAAFQVLSQLQDLNYNYVVTSVPQDSIKDVNLLATSAVDKVSQTIQYIEGLGRPMQTVITQGSPLKKDVVQPVAYDAFGREATRYLPYVASGATDGRAKTGFVMAEAGSSYLNSPQYLFYQGSADVATDAAPYAKTVFETSPMNRPTTDYGAGSAWQASSTTAVRFAYTLNQHGTSASQEKVIAWVISSSDRPARATAKTGYINTGGYYASGMLDIKETTDEQGHRVREYTNNSGQVILKKVQAQETATDLNSNTAWALTYYVYDAIGKLRFVLPPELSKVLIDPADAAEPTQAQLNTWAFQYTYDAQLRMATKRVPGAGVVYMVYDKRDRLVLTQDANQRSAGKIWSFTKYDSLNRPVLTGSYTHSGSDTAQAQVQTYVNTAMNYKLCETYNNTSATHGYTNNVFPKTGTVVYTATYYDTYDFRSMSSGLSYRSADITTSAQAAAFYPRVRGLATGTKVNILGTSNYLFSVTYYDDKYRVVQTISQNHKSGYDRSTSTYDFSGKVLENKRTYKVNTDSLYVKETYAYDHAGRVLTVKHSTKGATAIIVVKNTYNELGQLIDKQLHSTDGINFKQSVDYRYNIRGWLTKINEADVSAVASGDASNDYFGMELSYNISVTGLTMSPVYNGNIAAIRWSKGNGGIVAKKAYAFEYDPMNRLQNANHYDYQMAEWKSNKKAYNERNLKYDLNGNIQQLVRYDFYGYTGTRMDSLIYNYSGNRLMGVIDYGDATKGFINGTTGTSTSDYAYDANGNLKLDNNKGITAIAYNVLNLASQVNKGSSDYLTYTYNAAGQKLAQQAYGSAAKTTDYIGELLYEGNALKSIQFSEGRIVPDGANWEYQYNLKDHLGNVRVTFTSKTQTTTSYTTNFESTSNTDFTNYFSNAFDLVDHTDAAGTTYQKIQTLNGGTNGRTGLSKSFAVMPGDVIVASAYVKYMNLTANPNPTSFISTLASAFGVSSSSTGEGLKIYNGLNNYAGLVAGGEHASDDDGAPKGFVTILFFDKDYNLLDAAWDQVSTAGEQTSGTVKQPPHDFITVTAKAPEAGYAYVFLSNEHPTYVDIYFDDATFSHTPSAIVNVSDYFPFGLTYNAGDRAGSYEQVYKYNGKEVQNELDLGWMDYGARMYDASIGRWNHVDYKSEKYNSLSPYNYAINNPLKYTDPDGKDIKPVGTAAEMKKINSALEIIKKTNPEMYERLDSNHEILIEVKMDKLFQSASTESSSSGSASVVLGEKESMENKGDFSIDISVLDKLQDNGNGTYSQELSGERSDISEEEANELVVTGKGVATIDRGLTGKDFEMTIAHELGHADFTFQNKAQAYFLPTGEKKGHEEGNPSGKAADDAVKQFLERYQAVKAELKKN